MKFYKRIILTLVITAVLLFILNSFYQKGYRNFYKHETERIKILLDKDFYTDIIFIGSSRTHMHNNPQVVDSITHFSSYNFGIEGSNLLEMNLWFNIYVQKHANPKMIILDIPSFGFDTDKKKFYNPTIYFPYLDNEIIYNTLVKYKPVWLYKYIPFLELMDINDYDKSNAVKGLFGKQDQLSNSFNYRGFVENPVGKGATDTVVSKITAEAIGYLNNIIESCKKKNIKLIITYSPEYFTVDYKNMTPFFNFINATATKNKIPFWDYRKSPLCKDSSLFANPNHLNKHGADLFSAELARDIVKETGK